MSGIDHDFQSPGRNGSGRSGELASTCREVYAGRPGRSTK
jgi:hypothetical protein